MICTGCNHTGQMRHVDDYEYVPYGNTMVKRDMSYDVCPKCGGDDVEPCQPCGVCGDMVGESTRLNNDGWICDGCRQDAYDKLQAFRATLKPAEVNAIAAMLEDYEAGAWAYVGDHQC